MEGRRPILTVYHDADDGLWQFLDGRDSPNEKDAVILCLKEVLELDPSVKELADLPLGWVAWRKRSSDPWQRAPNENNDT
jgi:hypothetical protein